MNGRTVELAYMSFKKCEPLPEGPSRDRSLRGKARIKARKAARR